MSTVALVVLIVCGLICTLTLVLTDDDGRIRDRWRRRDHTAGPAEAAADVPQRAGSTVTEPEHSTSSGACDDIAMAWTALDDLQLDRLLRHGAG